jgi:hypothetical protein
MVSFLACLPILVTVSWKSQQTYFVIAGGSENVNYAVQILMGLLVKMKILDEVFCNRLPPG